MNRLHVKRFGFGCGMTGAAVLDDVLGLLVLTALVAFASPALSVTGFAGPVILRLVWTRDRQS